MENNNFSNYTYKNEAILDGISTNKAVAGSFLWMFLGALITLFVGIGSTSIVANLIISNPISLIVVFLVCFVFQIILTTRMHKFIYAAPNFSKSLISFVLYSALTGFTFSFLFVYFDVAILNQVFAAVSLYFLLLAFATYLFRKKIKKAAAFAYVGLSVLFITSSILFLVSLFAFNGAYFNALYLGISILGILVFSITTMVDIRRHYDSLDYSVNKNVMMIGFAFDLYLDFINIFIYVLRILLILGKNVTRRD